MEYAAAPTAHADLCAPHAARWHLGPQYHTPRHRAHRRLAGPPHTSHAPRAAAPRARPGLARWCDSSHSRRPCLVLRAMIRLVFVRKQTRASDANRGSVVPRLQSRVHGETCAQQAQTTSDIPHPFGFRSPLAAVSCDTANAMEGDWWRRVRRVWQLGGPAALHAMTARVMMRPEAPSGAIDLCSTRARVSPLLQLLLLRTVSRATVVVAGPGPGPDLMAFNSAARLAASAVDATASREITGFATADVELNGTWGGARARGDAGHGFRG